MSTISRRRFRPTLISLATAYADQAEESLELPEDLTTLSDDEIAALTTRADEAFDAIYGDGSEALSDADAATLASLTDAIEALAAESTRREQATEQRRADADSLAARRAAALGADTDTDGADDEGNADDENGDDENADDDNPDDEDNASEDDNAGETITAAGQRRPLSINLGAANRRSRRAQPKRKQTTAGERTMRDYAFAATGELGVQMDQGITHAEAGQMLGQRLAQMPKSSYEAAARRGQHMREQHPLMTLRRNMPADLIVASAHSVEEASEVIKRAVDQSRLPGGALTAAGWCAPSEPMYDICTTASRDGLLSIPEVGVSRGGLLIPRTPSYADLYNEIGFHFTEADAIAGRYAAGGAAAARQNTTAVTVGTQRSWGGATFEVIDEGTTGAAAPAVPPIIGQTVTDGDVVWRRIAATANVEGSKPCFEMPCPTWDDVRLEGDGLCLTADLITQRGYPEGLEWATENALIAHDHKISAGRIAKMVAGSTNRVMTTGTVGTTAPLLAAIEVRAEAIRYGGVLARNTLLEGVFPYWVRGAIRQDLSVRLGVDLLEVTDQRIDGWFRQRGIVPQYVYDWQMIPMNSVTWPATVSFLMYEAGAWLGIVDDIITLNTVYDSTQLGENKYTALFTEEAWNVAARCGVSELVTVPVNSNGGTAAGELLEADLQPAA
ncbi:major capsid hexamer protein [Microbacterium phage Smarties]|uniref:Major capsid hexamer protein n=1 Tax=Microbacterium phage Ariadne TaxID=2656546 RepID=A0A649VBE1_9CAUD|nr:major capsid hexamer protein [Microbacterium phage Ariadne]QGJ89439.1 major capsid hexamer protein [Microbacterium phage Ariadne]QGJ91426.1 major capsid hexamer protein [Microbacterium phage Smarties]